MKTSRTSVRFFELICHTRVCGTLLVGGLLVIFWLGGHGAIHKGYRVTNASVPAVLVVSR